MNILAQHSEESGGNESNNSAICVKNISKVYSIYDHPVDRLKQFLYPSLKGLFGRQSHNYCREFWALANISFEVKKGETVGIIGRNGAGKSTLLQLICGTLHPSSGSVETHGRIAALLELGCGFNREFTGRENVYLNAAMLGLANAEINKKFDDIATFADIGNFIEQPVKCYSSGMVVRLAFAVQAMIDPDILIVDEALSVGDEKFRRKCFARLEQLKKNGTSILFVSHSGQQIIELCDRALLLEAGERLMFTEPKRAVGAYQKLIYAPRLEQKRLARKFKAKGEGTLAENKFQTAKTRTTGSPAMKEYFDPGLIPETTVVYPEQGVSLSGFKILNELGQEVNILLSGKTYQLVIAGCFLSDTEGIHFGIHIRTISGATVTGQRHPEKGKFLGSMSAGDNFEISFGFQMCLLPGVYFIGGGVWKDQGDCCLHRIMDALMFRVVSNEPERSFGYCSVVSRQPELKIV